MKILELMPQAQLDHFGEKIAWPLVDLHRGLPIFTVKYGK
jgi:hypothetical protein